MVECMMTAAGMIAVLLIVFIAVVLFVRTRISAGRDSPVLKRRTGAGNPKLGKCDANPVRQRLAEEKARLERLDAERERRGDPGFGRTAEERIVWFELIELELQDIDEQVSRISHAASGAKGRSPRE